MKDVAPLARMTVISRIAIHVAKAVSVADCLHSRQYRPESGFLLGCTSF